MATALAFFVGYFVGACMVGCVVLMASANIRADEAAKRDAAEAEKRATMDEMSHSAKVVQTRRHWRGN